MMRYYHNPRCSKSRQGLALLHEHGIEPQIVAYLDDPLSADDLRALIDKLGIPARSLLRTGEDAYVELGLADTGLDDAALIAAMASHPKLIERPIFENDERAIIGRPPERVLEISRPRC